MKPLSGGDVASTRDELARVRAMLQALLLALGSVGVWLFSQYVWPRPNEVGDNLIGALALFAAVCFAGALAMAWWEGTERHGWRPGLGTVALSAGVVGFFVFAPVEWWLVPAVVLGFLTAIGLGVLIVWLAATSLILGIDRLFKH